MLLAGLPVPDRLVLELAQCLRTEGLNDTAEILEAAYDDKCGVVALTISDREAILGVLEYCPYGLSELRGVLLLEHEWRLSQGLVTPASRAWPDQPTDADHSHDPLNDSQTPSGADGGRV